MKKILAVCSLAAVSLLLLADCNKKNNVCGIKNSTAEQPRKKPMTRLKTASGLEYDIIKEGSGASPKKGQMVTVHYTGWLKNSQGEPGKKFDSSKKIDSSGVDRSQPFSFEIGMGRVIPGWDEGVLSMKIGEIRRLIIPSHLGYGARGAGAAIPAHADLIFDVELLSVS